MGDSGSRLPTRQAFPHLTDVHWATLEKMVSLLGVAQSAAQASATSTATFAARPTTTKPVKMSVPTFDGKDSDSFVFWVREIEIALSAGQIDDARAQVAFALSNLGGHPRAWAMAGETATLGYFTSWSFMEHELRSTFLLAHVTYRHHSNFLRYKQGKRSLQEYVVELHNLEAAMTGAPLSEDVKVTIFMGGVRTGPRERVSGTDDSPDRFRSNFATKASVARINALYASALEASKSHTNVSVRLATGSIVSTRKVDEDVTDYIFSAKLYFESKNVKYGEDSPQQRPLSLLVANLKGPAAAWYREYVSHDGNILHSVTQFEELLTSEFTPPPDRQEHLRDQLLRLRQNNFQCLQDYVSAFRHIICKEVKLHQFRTTTDAISFALMYDRTHAVGSRRTHANRGNQGPPRQQQVQSYDEESTPMEIGSSRFASREESLRRSTSFRTSQSSFHRIIEDETENEEVLESMQLNMVSVAGPKRELLRFNGVMNGEPVRVLIDSGAEPNIVRPGLAQHFVDAAKVTAERFDGSITPARAAQRCHETVRFNKINFVDVSIIEWEVSPNHDLILGHPWLVQFNPSINWKSGDMQFEPSSSWQGMISRMSVPSTIDSSAHQMVDAMLQDDPTMSRLDAWNKVVPLGYGQVSLPSATGATIAADDDDAGATAELREVSDSEFEGKRKDQAYVEIYNVRVKTSPQTKSIPRQLQSVLEEFADVFPVELPPELPPTRSIEHEVILKPGAQPSNRAPFRLSKVEQEALALRRRPTEEALNSGVGLTLGEYIFGVPKKDPVTGKVPSMLEWLLSNNPNMPIRWVIDYRLVNAASEVAKIPLPHIQELFYRMEGARVFSISDLLVGIARCG
ncbi:unnamed protein product [Phytophthora fragariaefolia]|uniref:Unnamed protein product n=1 Tax=Phytophthora fragariaefolia TaxID=1490495 RepID=A0A9W7CX18_9STRA|nr:unnamed protein product [Phytophthora fragariaefolia]